MRSSSAKLLGAALTSALVGPATAHADDVASTCLANYEQGQVAQKAGQFERARGSFAECMRAECSRIIQARCGILAQNLEAVQPSTLIVAHGPDGNDVVAARFSLDGQALRTVPVTAMRLDPGDHVVRVEADGFSPSEQRFVLREGEKERRIEVALQPRAATDLDRSAPTAQAERGTRSGPPTTAWILGGVAAASLVAAATTGAIGWGVRDHLASSCKPTCASDQVAPVKTLWITSFIALGVGVVTGTASALVFASHHDSP
jgi:hypothetical protein